MGGVQRPGQDFVDYRMRAESEMDSGSSRSNSARDFMEGLTGLLQALGQVLGTILSKGGAKGGGGGKGI